MKFVSLYLLTFIISRDNCVEGELSEADLQFIADRLYPEECSQLLSYLPGARETSRLREHRDEWTKENSRMQCLESLYESNRRGKSLGFTRNWLEGALRKLGRADLVARLKKRKVTKKPKVKKKHRKQSRAGRSSKKAANHKEYTRKKAVTSHVRGARKRTNKIAEDLRERRFVIFLATGSVLVLVFFGCIVVVFYRRACRCYNNYLHYGYDAHDEKRDDAFTEGNEALHEFNETRETAEALESSEGNGGYEKLVDSEKEKTDDSLWSENIVETPNFGKRNVSFDSRGAIDEEGCKCHPNDKNSIRKMSPCAKIKRFFDSQKRHLFGEEYENRKTRSEHKKIRKESGEKYATKKSFEREGTMNSRGTKNDRRKTRKSTNNRRKRRNREKRGKSIKSYRKDAETAKIIGCTCEMCKLFNVTDDGGCKARIAETQRITRRRKS